MEPRRRGPFGPPGVGWQRNLARETISKAPLGLQRDEGALRMIPVEVFQGLLPGAKLVVRHRSKKKR